MTIDGKHEVEWGRVNLVRISSFRYIVCSKIIFQCIDRISHGNSRHDTIQGQVTSVIKDQLWNELWLQEQAINSTVTNLFHKSNNNHEEAEELSRFIESGVEKKNTL